MTEDDEMEIECMSCGSMFRGTLYAVDREVKRVAFDASDVPTVHVKESEDIGSLCSVDCRERGRDAVMKAEGVPIRRPGIGPIESCAKCGRPVDMTNWHRTYLDHDLRFSGSIGQTLRIDYLAVLCRACGSGDVDGERLGEDVIAEQPEVAGTGTSALTGVRNG